jgi:hypothetical protein
MSLELRENRFGPKKKASRERIVCMLDNIETIRPLWNKVHVFCAASCSFIEHFRQVFMTNFTQGHELPPLQDAGSARVKRM